MAQRTCSFEDCPGRHKARGWCLKHYMRWLKGNDPAVETQRDRTSRLRLEVANAVAVRDRTGECWTEGDFRLMGGYPVIGATKAGHLAMELDGRPRPPGAHMLHSCDVPACWSPAHLRWGTRAENIAEMWERGRGRLSGAKGERHGGAKLTEAAVREIRARHASGAISAYALAPEYDVSPITVTRIINRERWKHLD